MKDKEVLKDWLKIKCPHCKKVACLVWTGKTIGGIEYKNEKKTS